MSIFVENKKSWILQFKEIVRYKFEGCYNGFAREESETIRIKKERCVV